jgi:hypothetical protein
MELLAFQTSRGLKNFQKNKLISSYIGSGQANHPARTGMSMHVPNQIQYSTGQILDPKQSLTHQIGGSWEW